MPKRTGSQAVLVLFSFTVLVALYTFNRRASASFGFKGAT
jgi:hypothetical protein